tara:strand:+ start:1525 stop:2685 length:1161 start_codon:yes stop_codon:yes gene_type:complete
MGLLGTTKPQQYYQLGETFNNDLGNLSTIISTNIAELTIANPPTAESEFRVYLNDEEQFLSNYTYSSPNITFTHFNRSGVAATVSATPLTTTDEIVVKLINRLHGDYRYITLKDIVNNFMIGYVGDGKLINSAKRSDVLFHAKRCIAEFNYDIGRVEKIQEVEVGPSLSIPMPQDYINYVKICWIDTAGIEHLLYPADYTSKPSESIIQDSNYEYLFTTEQDLITADPSVTSERFNEFNSGTLSGSISHDDYYYWNDNNTYKATNFGMRYGIEPKYTNDNGVFIIDELNGKITFDSSLSEKVVTLQYISDGLGTDSEMKIHKFAEEGMYKSLLHDILATRAGIPEYVVRRYKIEKRAAMRNAKLRLSNIKLAEMTQIMKGKNKWIK